jgi:PAS domain S-box-containing protein/putative nucleotidyltransferase with HDIG domain
MMLENTELREMPARILVVDDTPENLAVLTRVLREHGHSVVTALSGKRALQVASRETPDLVLLDVRMPEMDGYEVCRRFKADPALAAIPIVFISAASDTEIKIKTFTSGGVDFISKPFEPEEVLARVQTHLALRAMERNLERQLTHRTEQLRASERRYRSLVETLHDDYFFYSLDPDGQVVYVSQSINTVLGYTPDEFSAHYHDYLTSAPLNEQARNHRRLVCSGERPPAYPIEIRHRNGEIHRFEISECPILDPQGAVLAVEGIGHDITQRTLAENALRRTNRALKTLTNCNGVLVHATDEGQLLAEMCRVIVEIGGYRLAWIGMVDETQQRLRSAAHLGDPVIVAQGAINPWGEGDFTPTPLDSVVRSGTLRVVQNAAADPDFTLWRAEAAALGYASALILPLAAGGGVFGLLSIHSAEPNAFDDEEVRLLAELGEDLGYGLSALRTRANHDRTLQRLEASMEATIQAIAGTVEMRDPYTAGHQQRVAHLAEAIAREMGMPENEVHGLYLASIVHDLGKIRIPAEILAKPGRLSPIEYELIKIHATAGFEILKAVDFPWPIALIVSQHHERLDGSGYPKGLVGDEILLHARIIAVADVVEAMASHRPYRPALGIEVALAEIQENQGRLYDSSVVTACLRLFRDKSFAFSVRSEDELHRH